MSAGASEPAVVASAASAISPAPRRTLYSDIKHDVLRAAWERMPDFEGDPSAWEMFTSFLRLTTLVVVAYRLNRAVQRLRIPVVKQLLAIPVTIFDRTIAMMTGVTIMPSADIGPGLLIHTPYAINIGGTRIGENCTVASGVTIAAGSLGIGDNVYFGAGAKLIGDAKIGNNVVIVANSLVLTDVKDNLTVVGVPARIKLRGGRPQRFRRVATGGDSSAKK